MSKYTPWIVFCWSYKTNRCWSTHVTIHTRYECIFVRTSDFIQAFISSTPWNCLKLWFSVTFFDSEQTSYMNNVKYLLLACLICIFMHWLYSLHNMLRSVVIKCLFCVRSKYYSDATIYRILHMSVKVVVFIKPMVII